MKSNVKDYSCVCKADLGNLRTVGKEVQKYYPFLLLAKDFQEEIHRSIEEFPTSHWSSHFEIQCKKLYLESHNSISYLEEPKEPKQPKQPKQPSLETKTNVASYKHRIV